MVGKQEEVGRIGKADRAGRASPLNRLRRFRLAVLIPCAALAGCDDDRGQCLATKHIPHQMTIVPTRIGNVTYMQQIHYPARDRCVRWEFPHGREASNA